MAETKTKTMARKAANKPRRKAEDKAQYERFREFARQVETDDDAKAFDRRFRTILTSKRPKSDQ
jgi:hypothetical protein